MDSAFRLFSSYRLAAERLIASEVRSREDARKLGPFVDESRRRFVLWRRASFDSRTRRRKRRSHFAYFPRHSAERQTALASMEFDPASHDQARLADPKHGRARDLLVKMLRAMVSEGRAAPWAFVDERVSEFPLTGNLLEGVVEVVPEYPFSTPFEKQYRFDIALLGPKVSQGPMLLGAIEIEFSHRFELLKCLLCKSLGFPLLSVDITETAALDITEDWGKAALLGTTATNAERRRINFVYLHEMLYPVYMDLPVEWSEERHHYIVFVRDSEFETTLAWLKKLKKEVGISSHDNSVLIQTVGATSEQAKEVRDNEGSIAGSNWREFNEHRYIRVVLDRPTEKRGQVYRFHLLMARLLNGHCDALVGYKYAPGIQNLDPHDPVWKAYCTGRVGCVPLLPKQVGHPVKSIFAVLSKITK